MTFVAGQIDGGLPQEFVTLAPVGVMALGTQHFPFRHRVVERQFEQASDLLVTPVAHQRLIDRHRHPFRTIDLVMVDVRELRQLAARMRVVAIGAGHVLQSMRAGFPGHGGVALVAAQAHVHAGFPADIVMRIVAGNALEPIDAIDLMGMGDLLEVHLLGVALVAGACQFGSQLRQGRMGIMTIDAGHAGLGVAGHVPVLLVFTVVTLQAHLGPRFLVNHAVGIVAGRALEVAGATDLVRGLRLEHFRPLGMTLDTGLGLGSTEAPIGFLDGLVLFVRLVRLRTWGSHRANRFPSRLRGPHADQGGRRACRHIVVVLVAVYAGIARVGMGRRSPLRPRDAACARTFRGTSGTPPPGQAP